MYGVYVHIPWCRIRCPYCAFNVDARRDIPHAAYTAALLRHWGRESGHFPGAPETVYFGGGTPSIANPDDIATVIRALAPAGEVTLEANPGGVDRERLAAFRDAGVTRLSLGVQSFTPHVAARLGRGHGVRENHAIVEDAAGAGFAAFSFDLIFGVPSQTLQDFEQDLDIALSLSPPHVSLYGLTIEEGTPFHRAAIPTADDDLWRDMYDLAVERLAAAGLDRYEVSNFARAGARSTHNEHYWRARHWAGIGAGAHGWRPDGARTAARANPDEYVASDDPVEYAKRPDSHKLASELAWSTLRHVDGLENAQLLRWTNRRVAAPRKLIDAGLVTDDGSVIRLTNMGFPLADAISEQLLQAMVIQAGPHSCGA